MVTISKNDLLTLIRTSLVNTTHNVSETDIQIFLHYINKSNIDNSSQVLPPQETLENGIADVTCGETLQYYADNYARTYHPYVALTVCVVGSIANILNVVVLCQKEMINAPINRILTALAVTDVMVMMEYVPYVYYYYIVLPKNMDFPLLGAVYILFHIHFAQTLHTTSICLTVMLAVWRFLALRYPTRQHMFCSQLRCTLGIAISSILPLILCAPTYITITITSERIIENSTKYTLYHTDLSETFKTDKTLLSINFWIYAVFIKLLPCGILTVISFWLIRTLFIAKKRKQVLRNFHCYVLNDDGRAVAMQPMKTERRAERTTKMLIAILFLFLVTEFPQGVFAFIIGVKGKDVFLDCYQQYGAVMDIMALISGGINFVLYCFMNRMFRKNFGLLVRERIFGWRFALASAESGGTSRENRTDMIDT